MSEWASAREAPIDGFVGAVEIRYRDKRGVTRTAQGVSFPPFGVSVDGADGSELPGARRNAFGRLTRYVPYSSVLYWREAEARDAAQ